MISNTSFLRWLILAALAVPLVAAGREALGQSAPAAPPAQPSDNRPIRAQTTQVVVPVSIAGGSSLPAKALERDDLRLFVDGRPIAAFQFLRGSETAAVTGVALDASSRAVMNEFAWIRRFVEGIIHQFSRQDYFFLAAFGKTYTLLQPPSSDRVEILDTLSNLSPEVLRGGTGWAEYFKKYLRTDIRDYSKQAGGGIPINKTAIAVDTALHQLWTHPLPKKSLILVTDGDENLAKTTLRHVQRYGIPIYALYAAGSGFGSNTLFRRGQMVKQLADESGGAVINLEPDLDPDATGRAIAGIIHRQYLLSFVPPPELRPDKTHAIRVETNLPGVTVTYRKSFRFTKE